MNATDENGNKPRRTAMWTAYAALCLVMFASQGPRLASLVEWGGGMVAVLGVGSIFAGIKTFILTRKREQRDFLSALVWSASVVAIIIIGNVWTK